MSTFQRLSVDPKKITTIFSLLTVFLLVVEGLLGFWLFIADSSLERIVAGVLMAIILVGFLLTLSKLSISKELTNPTPQGFSKGLSPAQKEATPEEINLQLNEKVAGTDGTYRINRPPNSWIVKQVSLAELVMENLNINDNSAKQNILGNQKDSPKNISLFKSEKTVSILPFPGETTIDGRMLPTALEIKVPTQLAIIPMERAQPPFYMEYPLIHNAMNVAASITKMGIIKFHKVMNGTIPESNKEFVQFEFCQTLENVLIKEKKVKDIQINLTIIGIKGELTDHLLVMNYPTFSEDIDAQIVEDRKVLESLVNSFEPQKVINPKERLRVIKEKAELSFENTLKTTGETMLVLELLILVQRLKSSDMDNPEQRIEAIRLLEPFKVFAEYIGMKDKLLNNLWDTLESAKKGDTQKFKKYLSEVIDKYDEEISKNREAKIDPPQVTN